jgi:hypothetical protein
MVQRRGCAGFRLEAVNCIWTCNKTAAQDLENNRGLRRIAVAAFGAGNWRANAKDDLDQTWLGKTIEAFFAVNPKTEEGSLFIRDNQIGSEVEAYQEKLTNDAANEL